MATHLITGTSSGIGLDISKQLSRRPSNQVGLVIATARNPSTSKALQTLAESSDNRTKLLQLDVTEKEGLEKVVKEVESILDGKGLDILINNAGSAIFTPEGIASVKVSSLDVLAGRYIVLIEAGCVSSTMGTFAKARNFMPVPSHSYKIAKAALNMLTVLWAMEYDKTGMSFIAISPGWVKTKLGGFDNADLEVEDSVKAILEVVEQAVTDRSMNGKLFNIHVPGWEHNEGLNQYPGDQEAF